MNKTLHSAMWERVSPMLASQRIPHAVLFVGPRHLDIQSFIEQFVAVLLCQQAKPCGHCRPCRLLDEGTHPDVQYVKQETADKAIKIDQIRNLQQDIYQTPQCGTRRIIAIESADRMNSAAANALLKILEEPPSHTLFILLAEQISSIPPTILSRCQNYSFSERAISGAHDLNNYLRLGQLYADGQPRHHLYKDGGLIISALCDLMEGKASPCTIADAWAHYNLDDLLWWLYLTYAQAISIHYFQSTARSLPYSEQIMRLSRCTTPFYLFHFLDKIGALREKIHHNIIMNQTLVIEDFLIYCIQSKNNSI